MKRLICLVCLRPLLVDVQDPQDGRRRAQLPRSKKVHPDCLWRWANRRKGDRERMRTIEEKATKQRLSKRFP